MKGEVKITIGQKVHIITHFPSSSLRSYSSVKREVVAVEFAFDVFVVGVAIFIIGVVRADTGILLYFLAMLLLFFVFILLLI